MQLRSPLPQSYNRPSPFCGRDLSDVLEARTAAAVTTIQSLDAWDDDTDQVAAIASAYDVTVPTPRWTDGSVQIGATTDQRMIAVWSWTVDGDDALMTFSPTTRLSSDLPNLTAAGRTLIATLTEPTLTAARIEQIAAEARRWVDKNLANVAHEVETWRTQHRISVRDALRKRRALIELVLDLQAVTQ